MAVAPEPLTPAAFAERCAVSRETLDRLECYAALLRRWQRAINLVGQATLGDPWRRHFWDSAQLMPLLPPGAARLVDLGSGAGFPGMVLAVMGVEGLTLVESDQRKCAFLQEVARETGAAVTIRAGRLEDLRDRLPPPDVFMARAVAALPLLLKTVKLYMMPSTICFFHKGRRVEEELTEARRAWSFTAEKIHSRTDPSGVILRLEGISHDRNIGGS